MEGLVAVVAVVVGWGLNEVSQFLRRSSAQKGAAGRALVELLELRHYISGINLLFAEIKRRMPMSSADALAAFGWADQFLAPDPTLPTRYEKAITELAESDPILAHRLRGKDQILPILAKMRAIRITDPNFPDLLYAGETFVREKSLIALNKQIRDLAWRCGPLTWLRVWRLLSTKPELPPDAISYLDRIFATAKGGGPPDQLGAK